MPWTRKFALIAGIITAQAGVIFVLAQTCVRGGDPEGQCTRDLCRQTPNEVPAVQPPAPPANVPALQSPATPEIAKSPDPAPPPVVAEPPAPPVFVPQPVNSDESIRVPDALPPAPEMKPEPEAAPIKAAAAAVPIDEPPPPLATPKTDPLVPEEKQLPQTTGPAPTALTPPSPPVDVTSPPPPPSVPQPPPPPPQDMPPPPPPVKEAKPEARPTVPEPVPCPWTLKIEIIDGRTVMQAQSGKQIHFRVDCQQVDLQAPRGVIIAQGNVKMTGPELKGSCDRLVINWQDENVQLDGSVYLKCRKEGQMVELKSEKLSLKLSVISPVGDITSDGPVSKSFVGE